MKFQIVLLGQIHQRSDRTQAESAISQRHQRRVQAGSDASQLRGGAGRVQAWHQGKHADAEQERRGKRPQEPKSRPQSDSQISRDDRPGDKSRCLVKIRHRAMVQGKAALDAFAVLTEAVEAWERVALRIST